MPPRTFIDAIRETLADEMRRDETVIVLGEDVGKKGGVFLATDGLWAEFGDDRVIDTPLTESMIVGASIGAAVNGLRPVAEIQFADFIFPAFNQIVSEAARMRYRSNNGYGVPMTIRAPYGGGVHGALYHSQSVEAFFTHVPGLKVVVPSTPYDARGLLRSSIRDGDPVLFFEHKKMYRSVRGDVPDTDYTVPLGVAKVTHPGSQVTVVAYGLMAHYALEAADLVAEDGISVEVVDLRTLRPLDRETLLDSVRKTGKCLVVYEDNKFGGYGAEVAAIVAEEAFDYLDGPVTRIAGPEVPGRPVQPRPRGLVHGQPGEDRRGDPEACRVLTSARSSGRLREILEPYRGRLVATKDGPGRPHPRDPRPRGQAVGLRRGDAARQALREPVPDAGLRVRGPGRGALAGAPPPEAGQVLLQLHDRGRAVRSRSSPGSWRPGSSDTWRWPRRSTTARRVAGRLRRSSACRCPSGRWPRSYRPSPAVASAVAARLMGTGVPRVEHPLDLRRQPERGWLTPWPASASRNDRGGRDRTGGRRTRDRSPTRHPTSPGDASRPWRRSPPPG